MTSFCGLRILLMTTTMTPMLTNIAAMNPARAPPKNKPILLQFDCSRVGSVTEQSLPNQFAAHCLKTIFIQKTKDFNIRCALKKNVAAKKTNLALTNSSITNTII